MKKPIESSSTHKKDLPHKSNDPVRIFSLGGLGEIGKNMYGIEYKNEIVLIDAGLKFPDAEMAGVDYIIPDIRYLVQKANNIKGLFLTHGHEDHIGAIPYLLKQISVPIYGGALTIGLLKAKLDEHQQLHRAELHVIQGDETVSFNHLHVDFFRTMHSIPDSFGIVVDTPHGSVVHTGDFKFDFTPEGASADIHKMMKIGEKGALALLSDSTNSERMEQTTSDETVGQSILHSFQQCSGRILFATFASNVYRLQQAVRAALACNRKIAIIGRSMDKIFNIGQELSYIDMPEGTLIDIRKVHTLADHKVLIICTGSQGEVNAALTRIASGSHRNVQIQPGDTVIFSSSPIPGNVRNVNRSIDMLMRSGADVIYGRGFDIHSSGHGSREDLKLMLRTIRPQYLIPIHGEYRMLVSHQRLAEQVGIPSDHIFLLENGETVEITPQKAYKGRGIPSGSIFVGRNELRYHEKHLMEERSRLAVDGVVVAAMTIRKKTRELVSGPDLISRGFVYMNDSRPLLKSAEMKLKSSLQNMNEQNKFDLPLWKDHTVKTLNELFYKELGRVPLILPSIHEI
ncbi:ribonuclease J [Paenibacillus sp.]